VFYYATTQRFVRSLTAPASLDRNQAAQVFKFLGKYRPETKAEKKERLQKEATAIEEGKKREDVSKKPYAVKYGLNRTFASPYVTSESALTNCSRRRWPH
jgi:hypothetical protein